MIMPAAPTSHARTRSEPSKEGRKSQHWLLLEQWVREEGWKRGAEIGLQRGWTICHLLETFPFLSMIGVDSWKELPDDGEPGWQSYDHIDLDYWADKVKRRVKSYGERGIVYHMSSMEAVELVPDGSLDFVFIDADHRESACMDDIYHWSPKIKWGGYVCGHDWQYDTVRSALDKLLPGWERHDHQCWRIPNSKVNL